MAQRYMFINSSAAEVKIHVVTQDSIDVCELVESTPVEKPEQMKESRAAGELDLTIPRGAVYGFVTMHTAAVKDPQLANFEIRTVNTNVPWPEPPPSRSGLNLQKSDFKARYRCFLDSSKGVPVLARPMLARAADSSGGTNTKLDEIIGLLKEVLGWLAARGQHRSNGAGDEDDATVDA